MSRARTIAITTTLAALAIAGCVVTTHEGPGESPRGAVEPIWPPLGKPAEVLEPGAGSEPGSESEPEVDDAGATMPESIVASHILVMYRGSLRAPEKVKRSKQEARKRAEEALARAKKGENFAMLVAEYSDEPGAATRGGSLGRFRKGMMVPAFEKIAFGLEPGEISEIVETEFGFHIILRTE